MINVPVSVLIVTWNSADVIPACLEALAGSDPPPSQVVVVDNASTDGTVGIVEAARTTMSCGVEVVVMSTNTGFAAGMNRAIAAASQPYLLVLNPDLRVSSDMIGRLHDVMANAPSDVYAVGPKLLRASGPTLAPTGIIDSTGIQMTRDGRHFDRGAGTVDHGQFDEPEEVFGLSGAAALFRASSLESGKVDGEVFDEDFFAYREDADLAWRMRGFGYRALYEPTAVGYHRRRVTPERRSSLPASINRHSVKNRFLLRIHHADAAWLRAFGWRSLWRDVLVIGACLTIERSSFAGLVWVLRNWSRHAHRRRSVLGRRRVAGAALRTWFK